MDQPTFHARYLQMPEDFKAELIRGVVYMPAALSRSHGRVHGLLMTWLFGYEHQTPGVEAYDNSTTIMGEDSEPQPDACLILHPDKGGQMQFTSDDFLTGAPELVGEVASSTESYDLHTKKLDYERAGVKEYLVVALRQQKVFWFVNRNGKFKEHPPSDSGLFQSAAFPGLWLDPAALLDLDGRRLLEALQLGLTSNEHAAFAKRLASG